MLELPVHEQTVRDIGLLMPSAHNSRTHSDDQIEQVCDSMKKYGFTAPVIIDENNTIIAGHCRVTAASKVGIKDIPCVLLKGLSDIDKEGYLIADNKLALNAGWDFTVLQERFQFLKDNDFDLLATGFSQDEIDSILVVPELEGLCDADEIPEATDEGRAVIGDVWLLGDHRLLCGDSTVQSDVDKLLDGQHPNTMITDPPYGVKYEADWRAKAKGSKKTEREENSNLKNDDRADWYDAYVLFPGSVAYVWHASAFTDVVMGNLRDAGFDVKQQIIWNKNIHALSRSDYHWKHEPCWYAVKKGADRNWKGGRTQMTVWDVGSIASEKDKTAHPTQKPVELFERSIKHHTNPGEYVYDPFAGSGTLAIASEKTHRRALMMELDPKYCDVIIARWEKFTGKKAVRHEQ